MLLPHLSINMQQCIQAAMVAMQPRMMMSTNMQPQVTHQLLHIRIVKKPLSLHRGGSPQPKLMKTTGPLVATEGFVSGSEESTVSHEKESYPPQLSRPLYVHPGFFIRLKNKESLD